MCEVEASFVSSPMDQLVAILAAAAWNAATTRSVSISRSRHSPQVNKCSSIRSRSASGAIRMA